MRTKNLLALAISTLALAPQVKAGGLRDHPVDPGRIVVRVSSSTGRDSLRRVLARHANAVAEVTPHATFDQLLELDRPRSDAELRTLLADIGSEPGLFAARVRTWDGKRLIHATRRIHLRFEEHVSPAGQRAALDLQPELVVLAEHFGGIPDMWQVECAGSTEDDVLELVDALSGLPGVRWASVDCALEIAHANVEPTDCWYQDATELGHWGLNNRTDPAFAEIDVGAPEGWCVTTGSSSIRVAVIDDGIEMTHPDLNWNLGADFTNAPNPNGGGHVNSTDRHGTTVAGVITAKINNSCCSCPGLCVGVAPDCNVYSARVSHNGSTEYAWIIAALSWAKTNGARATVSSFVLPFDQALADAYSTTRADGSLLHFVASGNEASSSLPFPASLASTLAIGAVRSDGQVWLSSNYGSGLFCVAPGVNIRTLDRLGVEGFTPTDNALQTGTSYSAPMAAGVAALAWSARPELTPDDMDWVLLQSCKDLGPVGYDVFFGHGIPDAGRAVDRARDRHIDLAAGSSGVGTRTDPYLTVAEGIAAVPDGLRVYMKPGSYDETLVISRAMELRSDGGTAVIGE